MKKEYPFNMLDDIFKYSKARNTDFVYPVDILASTEYVLYRMTERHREALTLRYKQGKTLKEVGEHFGITPPGASVLINLALREMRRGEYYNFLRMGVEGMVEYAKKNIEDIYKERYKKLYEQLEEHSMKNERDMVLEDVDISVRAYNRLRRAGCKTVLDVISLGYGNLMSIRGLGKQTYDEIIFEFEVRGFDCTNIKNMQY